MPSVVQGKFTLAVYLCPRVQGCALCGTIALGLFFCFRTAANGGWWGPRKPLNRPRMSLVCLKAGPYVHPRLRTFRIAECDLVECFQQVAGIDDRVVSVERFDKPEIKKAFNNVGRFKRGRARQGGLMVYVQAHAVRVASGREPRTFLVPNGALLPSDFELPSSLSLQKEIRQTREALGRSDTDSYYISLRYLAAKASESNHKWYVFLLDFTYSSRLDYTSAPEKLERLAEETCTQMEKDVNLFSTGEAGDGASTRVVVVLRDGTPEPDGCLAEALEKIAPSVERRDRLSDEGFVASLRTEVKDACFVPGTNMNIQLH